MRATFVIDSDGVIAAINRYPMTIGRSVEALLRLRAALRFNRQHHALIPAAWREGEAAIAPTPVTIKDAEAQLEGDGVIDWCFRKRG